jgi:hypothetical protein
VDGVESGDGGFIAHRATATIGELCKIRRVGIILMNSGSFRHSWRKRILLGGTPFLQALLPGKASPIVSSALFWFFQDIWAVRDGQRQLVSSSRHPSRQPTSPIIVDGVSEEVVPALFNILNDPGEQHYVSARCPAISQELKKLFDEWRKEMLDRHSGEL